MEMRLLDRYLLRELFIPLGYCLGGFLVFWIAFDLFSDLGAFQAEKLTPLDIGKYYLALLPKLLQDIIVPAALLLALLYALTNHARHNELTAMRAAGVSLWRLCLPYLAVGLLFSVFLLLLNERWMPNSLEMADQIRKRHVESKAADRQWKRDLSFRNDRDARSWRIRSYNLQTGEMLDPYVEWTLPDGSRRQLLAERGLWTNGDWTFFNNVRQFVLKAGADPVPEMLPPTNVVTETLFAETPEQIRSEIKVSQLSSIRAAKKVQLSIAEILNYKRLHSYLLPNTRAMLDTQLQARLAAPWTCLVVVLIAIPFGAPSGRRNLFVGVAASIFICFAYFVLQKFGMALGTGGHLPPLLAAWLPNALFGGAGAWLTTRAR
jgi:LPS export ABC transporter permease LptG